MKSLWVYLAALVASMKEEGIHARDRMDSSGSKFYGFKSRHHNYIRHVNHSKRGQLKNKRRRLSP